MSECALTSIFTTSFFKINAKNGFEITRLFLLNRLTLVICIILNLIHLLSSKWSLLGKRLFILRHLEFLAHLAREHSDTFHRGDRPCFIKNIYRNLFYTLYLESYIK